MIEYIQKLGEEPSKENLDRVNNEMSRITDILINYHYLLSQITQKNGEFETPEIIEIKNKIFREEKSISECREVAEKIKEALESKK